MVLFRSKALPVAAAALLLIAAILGTGCSSSSGSSSPKSYSAKPSDGHIHTYNHRLSDDTYVCSECGYVFDGDPSRLTEGTPDMDNAVNQYNKSNSIGQDGSTAPAVDPRWPTTNPDLLAIPEEQRWYNGWGVAGTSCTLVGPVVNIYQAKDEAGMPIFVDIGEAYPSTDGVTLLVWGDQYYEFEEMLNDVNGGRAWLSVSGYLSVYNGMLQFDAGEGPIEYRWWTNVS